MNGRPPADVIAPPTPPTPGEDWEEAAEPPWRRRALIAAVAAAALVAAVGLGYVVGRGRLDDAGSAAALTAGQPRVSLGSGPGARSLQAVVHCPEPSPPDHALSVELDARWLDVGTAYAWLLIPDDVPTPDVAPADAVRLGELAVDVTLILGETEGWAYTPATSAWDGMLVVSFQLDAPPAGDPVLVDAETRQVIGKVRPPWGDC